MTVLKFVSSATSSQTKSGNFPTLPKLKKNDSIQISFLTQTKDFDPNSIFGNDPTRVEYISYYDEISKSSFRIATSVSEATKNIVLAKNSVKESKKTAAIVVMYDVNSAKQITGIEGVYILQMASDKMKAFAEIESTERMDTPSFSLFDVDYYIKCEDDKYQKWSIIARKIKAFTKFDASIQKECNEKARELIKNYFHKLGGKELDEADLIEKFALDISDDDVVSINPMAKSSEEDEFSHLKQAKSPFEKS